jgi:hypothetical protein
MTASDADTPTPEWCADLREIVRIRNRIDGGSGEVVASNLISGLLEAVLAGFEERTTDTYGVEWNPGLWSARFAQNPDDAERIEALAVSLPPSSNSSRKLISRSDIFEMRDDPRALFLAVMAWGYGLSGYGPVRARKILEVADATNSNAVHQAVAELKRCAGMEAIWKALSIGGDAKLRGVGIAFGSKVAYFTCYDREKGTGPLIADWRSAWGFWAVHGSWADGVWDIRKAADLYARYVDVAAMWAHDLGKRSDDIERALFLIGPYAKACLASG